MLERSPLHLIRSRRREGQGFYRQTFDFDFLNNGTRNRMVSLFIILINKIWGRAYLLIRSNTHFSFLSFLLCLLCIISCRIYPFCYCCNQYKKQESNNHYLNFVRTCICSNWLWLTYFFLYLFDFYRFFLLLTFFVALFIWYYALLFPTLICCFFKVIEHLLCCYLIDIRRN